MRASKLFIHNVMNSGLIVAGKTKDAEKIPSKKVIDWADSIPTKSEVYALRGGCADALLLRLHARGVRISQLPTIKLNGHKTQSEIIGLLKTSEPKDFLKFSAPDAAMTRLRIAVRAYQSIQKSARMPAEQRVLAHAHDLDLLEPVGDVRESKKLLSAEFDDALRGFTILEKEIVKRHFKPILDLMPIYRDYLSKIDGISHILAAQLIAPIYTASRFPHPRKLRKYSGRAPHNGWLPKRTRGRTLGYNPALKMVTYLIGESFIKLKKTSDSKFRKIYVEKKAIERKEHDKKCRIWSSPDSKPAGSGKRKLGTLVCSRVGHLNSRARHFTICRFLDELWETWTKMEKNGE